MIVTESVVAAWCTVLALLLFAAGSTLASGLGVLVLAIAVMLAWFVYEFHRSVTRWAK